MKKIFVLFFMMVAPAVWAMGPEGAQTADDATPSRSEIESCLACGSQTKLQRSGYLLSRCHRNICASCVMLAGEGLDADKSYDQGCSKRGYDIGRCREAGQWCFRYLFRCKGCKEVVDVQHDTYCC